MEDIIEFSIDLKNYNIKLDDTFKAHQDLMKKTSKFIWEKLITNLLHNIELT